MERLPQENFDLAIIGGGINGSAIARDAAGRGLKVFLAEKGDLGQGTSSASTKLIHGGLRYLEQYRFRLVRESLEEREVLWRTAPHLVEPLRFVLPHERHLRPRWILRTGLFLYDHIGGRKRLPPTQSLDLKTDPAGAPLRPELTFAFEYSDCRVDDARLVVLNALDAKERGATIATRHACLSADRGSEYWRVTVEAPSGEQRIVEARALVNAAGPFVAEVERSVIGREPALPVRLVKGSHIVVPKLFTHDRAYIFQNDDGRIVFAIPYAGAFTLIGTTDLDYDGDPARPACEPDEIAYLCRAVSAYFRRPVEPGSVVWTYSGLRALPGDGDVRAQDASRDYLLTLDAPSGQAPLLTVYGGKITTSRRLAEAALDKLKDHLRVAAPWTAKATLPGGDFAIDGLAGLSTSLAEAYSFLEPAQALRLARAYGTRASRVLGEARRESDLGHRFGDLTEAEAEYLIKTEWAVTADDILWRRSKLGLTLAPSERQEFEAWVADRAAALGHA